MWYNKGILKTHSTISTWQQEEVTKVANNCKAPMFSCSVPAAYTLPMLHRPQAFDTIHMLSDYDVIFDKAVHLKDLTHDRINQIVRIVDSRNDA